MGDNPPVNRFVEVVSSDKNPKFRYCRLTWAFDVGDPVVSPRAWTAAQELVDSLRLQESDAPSVVPDLRGGLQLEWHAHQADVEVYVETDGAVSLWYSGPALRSLIAGAVDRRLIDADARRRLMRDNDQHG